MVRCAKCGQALGGRPGMLVAGQSQSRKNELPASAKVAKPGGVLPRLIALIIDSLILLVILLPIMALWASQLTPGKVETGGARSLLDTVRGSLSLQLTLLLLQVFYFAGSWTIMAATPGQLLMSLRVADAKAAGIGFPRALFRYLMFSLFLVLAPVSALMVGLGKQKRAIHDLLSRTYVIQIVDRDDLAIESSLPPAFSEGPAPGAPALGAGPPATLHIPTAAPEPRESATYSPPRSKPAYNSPPSPSGASPGATAMGPPPSPARPSAPLSAGPPPLDFPPMPMRAAEVPPPPRRPAGGEGVDADLYAPPQMVDTTAPRENFIVPPPPPRTTTASPGQREAYTPRPGRPTPPPAPPASAETGPAHENELPPMEYPPMAPPPDPHT